MDSRSIELLVVIVIAGWLAAFVAPLSFDEVGTSNAKIAKVAKARTTPFKQALDQSPGQQSWGLRA